LPIRTPRTSGCVPKIQQMKKMLKQGPDAVLTIDGWIKLAVPARVKVPLLEVRRRLDNLFASWMADRTARENGGKELLNAVTTLLSISDEENEYKKQPINVAYISGSKRNYDGSQNNPAAKKQATKEPEKEKESPAKKPKEESGEKSSSGGGHMAPHASGQGEGKSSLPPELMKYMAQYRVMQAKTKEAEKVAASMTLGVSPTGHE